MQPPAPSLGYAQGKVAVIIPAYNEEAAIGGTLKRCLGAVAPRDIVVVDDGSRDATSAIAKRHGVACLRLPFNLGIGGAVQAGYLWAYERGYEVAVQLDADGQHDSSDLPRLVEPVVAGKYDMVVGSRYLTRVGYQSTAARRLGSWLLSRAIRACTGTHIQDVTSGFRAVNRRVLESFVSYYPSDYPEPESLVIALLEGFEILEVPVRMHERQGGSSSIRALDSVVYMTKVLSVIAAYGAFPQVAKERRE